MARQSILSHGEVPTSPTRSAGISVPLMMAATSSSFTMCCKALTFQSSTRGSDKSFSSRVFNGEIIPLLDVLTFPSFPSLPVSTVVSSSFSPSFFTDGRMLSISSLLNLRCQLPQSLKIMYTTSPTKRATSLQSYPIIFFYIFFYFIFYFHIYFSQLLT